MATRSLSFEAIVLRTRESPSAHRIAQLLCPDGVLDVFIFGGPKAKLRSLVSPWHAGRAWVYDDRAKGFLKLTDFDAREEFPRVRSDLAAIGSTSLASEFILATDALGGEGRESMELFLSLLRALDAGQVGAEAATAQFCLRALASLGVWPDAEACASCSRELPRQALHAYDRGAGGFVCPHCLVPGPGTVAVPSGAMALMARSLEMDFERAAAVSLSDDSRAALKAVTLDLLARAAHGRLKTLESGLV